MTIQTIELCGERYVILPEREFLELQKKISAPPSTESKPLAGGGFPEVIPLNVGGVPASELLIQDRR